MKSPALLILASLLFFTALQAQSKPDATPFPMPPNIKGIQVQMTDDALTLGIHHATINVSIGALMDLDKKPSNPHWTCEGEDYAFNSNYLLSLDAQIKPLSDAGIVVYLIVLAYPTKDAAKDALLVHSKARADGNYNIAAFNTATPAGARWFRACSEFMAARWSGGEPAHGRVWGWIVGNEVNSHWLWYNLGSMSLTEAASEHEKAFRILHQSVRKASLNARLYLSLDHHWQASMPGISAEEATSGRDYIDTFAKVVRERGDFDWHIAHHPYPDDLGNPRTWLDKAAPPNDNAPHVTFKNLEVLALHLARPELLWQGKPRRIILSEQGFHTLATLDGEGLQAAAFAYAWEKCQRVPLVDAFIYHRHVDHSHEGGLRLGLWSHAPGSSCTPHSTKQSDALFITESLERL